MPTARIIVVAEDAGSTAAKSYFRQFFSELADRFDEGFDPCMSISADIRELQSPDGVFVLAWQDCSVVGCGAFKRINQRAAAIKPMWTLPSARNQGVARAVLMKLEATALQMGFAELCLETNCKLIEARALYRKHGFKEVAPFSDERYANHWMSKELA